MIMQQDLDNWFGYHKPTPEQAQKYETINQACQHLAQVILDTTPACPDQTAAMRKLRELRMNINMTVACNPPS